MNLEFPYSLLFKANIWRGRENHSLDSMPQPIAWGPQLSPLLMAFHLLSCSGGEIMWILQNTHLSFIYLYTIHTYKAAPGSPLRTRVYSTISVAWRKNRENSHRLWKQAQVFEGLKFRVWLPEHYLKRRAGAGRLWVGPLVPQMNHYAEWYSSSRGP